MISSVEEFLTEWKEKYSSKSRGYWIYRGQSISTWKLEPSIKRATEKDISGNVISLNKRHEIESNIFRNFKKLGRPYFQIRSNWSTLAHCQHYGLPTRLIDWTYNPLTALYFASESHDESDGKVFILRTENYSDSKGFLKIDPFEIDKVYRYYPGLAFPRVIAQEGLFTAQYKIGEYLEDQIPEGWRLEEIIVKSSKKRNIVKQLSKLGITAPRLFPDIYGIVSHLQRQHARIGENAARS